jgi:2-phosphosulfolactate phosphatase
VSRVRVEVLDFVAGARAARGSVVVIDVFRAFSTACYAAAAGARLVPVADVEAARALGEQHPDWLLAGERHGRDLPGFHFGNSPARIQAAPLAGRTLVHTTHAGTQGLTQAEVADEVLTGSLVNAAAIVRYLRRRAPAAVSIVRMGHEARERSVEDDLCAEILVARLAGRDYDTAGVAARLRAAPAAAKFFDPAATWAPEADFELCAAIDRFDFVLRLAAPDAAGVRALERVDS